MAWAVRGRFIANSSLCRGPHVCVARRRVSSGLCRRAPHPRRQSAWVSSGESLFGTSGANRSTKLAQLRGCDSAVARRGRGRGSGSSTQRSTFPTFLKGGEGGETTSTTKACVYGHASLRSVDVHTMRSYVGFCRIHAGAEQAPRMAPNSAAAPSHCIVVRGHSCPIVRSRSACVA